jgi:hypothetical protein
MALLSSPNSRKYFLYNLTVGVVRRKLKGATLLAFTMLFSVIYIPASSAALSIGANTGNYLSSTGGGGLGTYACAAQSVLTGVSGWKASYDGTNVLTAIQANCGLLSSNGTSIASVLYNQGGPFGASGSQGMSDATCGGAGSTRVITGARLYKSASGFAAGIQLQCGTLPLGSNRSFTGSDYGTATGTYEDISCPANSVAYGLYVYYGGILDKFGISCARIVDIPQSISITSLGTSSKDSPYSQALNISTSGTSGSGAITFTVANGTATSCALNNNGSTATLTATTSGTCLITATIAADSTYAAQSSSASTFTFNLATQSSLVITSTSGFFGTPLRLTTSGGSGTGAVTFTYSAGTSNCTLNSDSLTVTSPGTCLITATKAADVNYSSVSSSQATITFSAGPTVTTVTFPNGNFIYGTTKVLTAVTNAPGKMTFKANDRNIPGCRNLVVNSSNSYTVNCTYKTAVHGALRITATYVPAAGYLASSASSGVFYTLARTTKR